MRTNPWQPSDCPKDFYICLYDPEAEDYTYIEATCGKTTSCIDCRAKMAKRQVSKIRSVMIPPHMPNLDLLEQFSWENKHHVELVNQALQNLIIWVGWIPIGKEWDTIRQRQQRLRETRHRSTVNNNDNGIPAICDTPPHDSISVHYTDRDKLFLLSTDQLSNRQKPALLETGSEQLFKALTLDGFKSRRTSQSWRILPYYTRVGLGQLTDIKEAIRRAYENGDPSVNLVRELLKELQEERRTVAQYI